MSKELEINLIEPIESHYNDNGKNKVRKIETLYFKAPNYKHRDLTLKLRQDFLGAMIGLAKGSETTSQSQEQSDEDFDLDAKSIRHIITLAGSNFDAPSFYNSFTALFLKEICFKDEEKKQKVLSSDLNNLSLVDLDQIIVRYIEVFFANSWMSVLK